MEHSTPFFNFLILRTLYNIDRKAGTIQKHCITLDVARGGERGHKLKCGELARGYSRTTTTIEFSKVMQNTLPASEDLQNSREFSQSPECLEEIM